MEREAGTRVAMSLGDTAEHSVGVRTQHPPFEGLGGHFDAVDVYEVVAHA